MTASGQLFGICINSDAFSKLQRNGSALVFTKTHTGDEIKYYRLSKNTKRQQENRPTSYREYQLTTTGMNWGKDGIDQKGFPDNGEDLQNAISPNAQIFQLEGNREKVLE